MDLRHPYLTRQLIAYIGNKRALLPFLHGVFAGLVPDPRRASFLDPFAGTGAVSRLARMMGFAVAANDWEAYAYAINSCHLGMEAADLDALFGPQGGIDAVLTELNAMPPLPEESAYISRHYAPRSTVGADWRTERLFYTRENALAIDAMRERIEEMYPGIPGGEAPFREKMALLAPLLYEAATHTNTSGVFKACHRGFGGHGGDALSRIMAPIRLRRPLLIDSPTRSTVRCEEAQAFLMGRSADLCYLDPPYAVHQYGSNYFMLTSIALWDRPAIGGERGPDGRLLQKAGIRPDWTRTRSAFCHPGTALDAMRDTVRAADCRWLVVSYSDEGIIGLEELCDLLAGEGALSLRSTGYVKYPGGKQSMTRTIRNQEVALVVDRRAAPGSRSVRRLLGDVRMARLMSGSFHPDRIRGAFAVQGEGILPAGVTTGAIPMKRFWRFTRDTTLPTFESEEEAAAFAATLTACAVRDVREEIEVLVDMAGGEITEAGKESLLREILRLLNRLAHRKYRTAFQDVLVGLRSAQLAPEGSPFRAGLDAVAERAERRLGAPLPSSNAYRPRAL